MDLLQLNKFGDLHNGKNIIFCKTDYLVSEFSKIRKLKSDVILISGNSDINIETSHTAIMPDNILFWYCQNTLASHEKLIPIPIGLENTVLNKRKGHGVAWPNAVQKVQLLNEVFHSLETDSPSKLVYANFNPQTNAIHRNPIKEVCISSPFITWDEPLLSYPDFIKRVLAHEATICPAGNGIDTHRLYEILYCDRIAITFKIGDYPIYRHLYEKLPVVILDKVGDLKDRDKIKELIAVAKLKKERLELLDFNYWKKLITASVGNIPPLKKGVFYSIFK